MDISSNNSSQPVLKRKLDDDESDDSDESDVEDKVEEEMQTRDRYSPEDIRALVIAFEECKRQNESLIRAYKNEKKSRAHAEKICDTVQNEMRVFTENMKREINDLVQTAVSHGMEKLSLDLSMGVTLIKNTLKNDNHNVESVTDDEDVVIIGTTSISNTDVNLSDKPKPTTQSKPQAREYNHKPKTTSNKPVANKSQSSYKPKTTSKPQEHQTQTPQQPSSTNMNAPNQRQNTYSQKAAKPITNAKTTETNDTPDIIFISDSNGYNIGAPRLKPGAKVKKQIRYTFEQATSLVPQTSDPHKVKDIVFQVGLNHTHNIQNDERTIDEIQDDIQSRALTMQTKYLKQFPNARQHIVALPPMTKEPMSLCML